MLLSEVAMERYIVVHPLGIWSFDDYLDASEFCWEDGVGMYDLNEIGTLKSRSTLYHPPIKLEQGAL